MMSGIKRWRVEFAAAKVKYDVEALNRQQALRIGYQKLRESNLDPAEANSVEDFKAKVFCLDEQAPVSKYDDRGFPRRVTGGGRHPKPQQRGGRGVSAPALRPGQKGRIKGST